ncbi:MAG: hypothetical protein VX899_23000 [Myxococcota bacterium]|nr:hypothetical protein [Myxococcota bacterium]
MDAGRAKLGLAAVGVALLALLLLWVWPSGPETESGQASESVGPRPEQTQRARSRGGRSDRPVEPASLSAPMEAPAQVLIEVSPIKKERLERSRYIHHEIRPNHWFPHADEVGMEDSETYAQMDAWLDGLGMFPPEASDPKVPGILEAAEAEGLMWDHLPPDADPWEGLLALQVEWLASRRDYSDQLHQLHAEYEARFGCGPYDRHQNSVHSNPEAGAWYEAHDIERDTAGTAALARELQETFPEHPVADFALLFELDVAADNLGDAHDAQAAVDLALHAFQVSSDPLVAQAAVSRLTLGHKVTLEPQDWELPERSLEEYPHVRNSVCVFALDNALASGDLDRAAHWHGLYAQALEGECACGTHREPSYCDLECGWLEKGGIQLQAMGALEPTDWESALRAGATQCAWEPGLAGERVEMEGTWDGQAWSWVGNPIGEFTSCIVELESGPFIPPLGQRVELRAKP